MTGITMWLVAYFATYFGLDALFGIDSFLEVFCAIVVGIAVGNVTQALVNKALD